MIMKERLSSFFRKLPIAQKFTFSAVLLVVIIMVVVNLLIITYQKSALKEEMENNQLLLIRNFAKDIVEPLMFLDPLRLDEHIQVTSQTPGCAYIMVTDRTGRIVAHTDRRFLGNVVDRYAYQKSAVDQQFHISENKDASIKQIEVPVSIGYERIGTAVAGFSKERMEGLIENSLSGLEHYILIISAIMLMTGIGCAVWLAKVLTTPMRNLKDKMDRVRAGDLNVAVEETGPDCREILSCRQSDCPAYGKKRCWSIEGTKCYGTTQNSMSEKVELCRSCAVYREVSGDEIGELIETFDDMVIRLRKSLEQLEKSNREKSRMEKLSALGEMSMTVAHEVKNPLNAISGAVAYLKDNFEGDVLREFLSIIDQETKRLNEIVTQYLIFSKPSPLRRQTADLNHALSDVVKLIRPEAAENKVEIIAMLDPGLQPFLFDLHQIKQALLNILVNAIDATSPGDTINVKTLVREGQVDVIMEDTGHGIGEEIISDIFKPFYTTKTRGSGLGLACVERIIREHRGEVSVSSETGKGTRFIISLPMEREL